MATETIKWWEKNGTYGVFVCLHDDEGNIFAECNPIPEGATEVTEEEFADFMRAQYLDDIDDWASKKALVDVEITQAGTDRQTQVDDLVTAGIPLATAEALVPPAPANPMSGEYVVPEGAAEALRRNYRLSQASIDAILAAP
jgi:hypothetical protein